MSSENADSTQRMFDLNRPQGYAKDDYLWQWKVANDTVFDIIRKSNGGQNTKDIVTAVMFAISLIAHDDIRRKEEIIFSSAIDHINSLGSHEDDELVQDIKNHLGNTSLSDDEKAHLILKLVRQPPMSSERKSVEILRVCAITMGSLTSYVDQFRGLAHTLKVGELVDMSKPYYGKKSAFGDNHDGAATDVIQL